MRLTTSLIGSFSVLPLCTVAQLPQKPPTLTWPPPTPGNFSISNFTFDSGDHLDKLDLHYNTLGKLQAYSNGSTNAVLILHGSTGSAEQFYVDEFAGEVFNPGQALDAEKYFLIIPDMIGHGNSSKPSNTGLRAKFPRYQYSDMIRANHRLLTEHLGVHHLKLILGVSMGGMHTWMMGEKYPKFMDALFPIASLPTQIAGQNRLWRKFIIELIQSDPAWKGGNYTEQPLVSLSGTLSLAQVMFSSSVAYAAKYPTRDAMDAFVDGLLPHVPDFDANDQLYAWNASHTYDPESELGLIEAPLRAVNTADDLMNPPEPKILQMAVDKRMKRGVGKAVTVPLSNETYGHGTYIKAAIWKDELMRLLAATAGGKSNCTI